MDSARSEPSGERIIQTLTQIGEIDRIKRSLVRDFEGTMKALEKIPEESINTIWTGSSDHPEEIINHIYHIQDLITSLLKKHNISPIKQELAKKLQEALQKKIISEDSIQATYLYLDSFCTHQPITKIPEWEQKNEDDDHFDRDIPDIYPSDEDPEVTKDEKHILIQCIRVIKTYIENLDMLVFHIDIDSTLRKQGIQDEKNRLKLARKVIELLRKITELSERFQPYQDLSREGGPFYGGVDLIIRWEIIEKEIRKQQILD